MLDTVRQTIKQYFNSEGVFMSILITGGAGYIGSHTCVELLDAGYEITVLDNYCNSCPESLLRVK